MTPDVLGIPQAIPALVHKLIVNFKGQNGRWEDKFDQVHNLIHVGFKMHDSDKIIIIISLTSLRMVPSSTDKSKSSSLGSWSVVLFDSSSGKRTLETRLMKGVPGLSIMEVSYATDCQDEIESGLSTLGAVGQPLSDRVAGGIADGCAAMNDMGGSVNRSFSSVT